MRKILTASSPVVSQSDPLEEWKRIVAHIESQMGVGGVIQIGDQIVTMDTDEKFVSISAGHWRKR